MEVLKWKYVKNKPEGLFFITYEFKILVSHKNDKEKWRDDDAIDNQSQHSSSSISGSFYSIPQEKFLLLFPITAMETYPPPVYI